jgi:cell wall assembly regulator SMI1
VAAFGSKVSASKLARMSGGSDVKTRVTLHGNVSDSTTKNVVTGTNSIAGHAFDHAVGLPVVIQNSGNSVVIQNATTVNLQLQP